MAYREGQTATGPNGEKIVYQGGQWTSLGVRSDPVLARDPYKAADEARKNDDQAIERERLRVEQERLKLAQADEARDAQEDAQKNAKVGKAQQSAVRQLRITLDNIDNAALLTTADNGWWETGRSGAFVRSLPNVAQAGTDAKTLEGYLSTVKGNTAFSALQEMRDNSPTGGALGSVTENELALLQSTLGSLDPDKDQQAFFSGLADVKRTYLDMLRRLDPAAADEYTTKPGIRWNKDGSAFVTSAEGADDREQVDPMGLRAEKPKDDDPPAPGGGGGLRDVAVQGITLGLSDEAAGIGGYLSGFFTGEDPAKAYVRERDAERAKLAGARKRYPILAPVVEFLGGAGGVATKVGALPSTLGSTVRQGAGLGALGGFGYGEGNSSVPNALVGAAGGAVVGGALHGVGQGIGALSRLRNSTAPDLAVVEAGQRQGIPIRQPDARPDLRNQLAEVDAAQTGGIVRKTMAADEAAIESRIAEVGGTGAIADPYALGGKVQAAGDRYIARTRQQASRLYDRARQEANGATVQPTEAVAAIDRNIAELRAAGENSNKGQIAYLEGLREDLSKPLSIEAVQSLRTNMRGQISERGLTSTDAERRVAQVIDAANQDLARELPQGASSALRAADDFYRERQTFINGVLKEFTKRDGSISGERAGQRLISMTQGKGNFDRFSKMWSQLEPEEQADVAATVASSLGRKANGEFSASALVRSLDPSKGINPRTARLLFGEDGAKALQDLRVISQAKTDTANALNNSRTGVIVQKTAGNLKTMLMAAFGFSTGGAGGAAAGAISREFLSRWGEQRAAKMLLNPDFTRWLRQTPNTTDPKVIDRHFGKLAGISSIAANDNQAFTRALVQSLEQPATLGRAAANEQEEEKRD